RRLGPMGGLELLLSLGRTACASLALLLWCMAVIEPLSGAWRGVGWTLAALGAGIVIYGAAAALLRAPELRSLRGILARRG
ncbi:MAG TPA: hypothetical protein VGR44_01795, partial [Methylomirabilota bacterium]|nr:hypothetical protein [Methylomirabilota bacterium]